MHRVTCTRSRRITFALWLRLFASHLTVLIEELLFATSGTVARHPHFRWSKRAFDASESVNGTMVMTVVCRPVQLKVREIPLSVYTLYAYTVNLFFCNPNNVCFGSIALFVFHCSEWIIFRSVATALTGIYRLSTCWADYSKLEAYSSLNFQV